MEQDSEKIYKQWHPHLQEPLFLPLSSCGDRVPRCLFRDVDASSMMLPGYTSAHSGALP